MRSIRWIVAACLAFVIAGCSHYVKLCVIDGETGQPMAKAEVHRWPMPYDIILSPIFDGWGPRTTGTDGRMDVRVRGDGTKYLYNVSAWDYESMRGEPRMESGVFVIDWTPAKSEEVTSRPDSDGVLTVRIYKRREMNGTSASP